MISVMVMKKSRPASAAAVGRRTPPQLLGQHLARHQARVDLGQVKVLAPSRLAICRTEGSRVRARKAMWVGETWW